MYIEEIIIDGFKSYAKKTTIGLFDKQFNAITGLNGSGKSNILDAICFVMGIQNLTTVRVQTLQELIYKSGQCGVTKATVTLIFNNDDKASSPLGYENHSKVSVARQITVSGKNKYTINSVNSTQKQVLTFFSAIGLNVNNPHFLIMQGKVMKVLRMRPKEIFAMVEEVTGTKFYETKRTEAMNVLAKKDEKLKEINNILEEDILPAREKIQRDADALKMLREKNQQKDQLECQLGAYEYFVNERKLEKCNEKKEEMRKELVLIDDIVMHLMEEIEKVNEEIERELKEEENNLNDLNNGNELNEMNDTNRRNNRNNNNRNNRNGYDQIIEEKEHQMNEIDEEIEINKTRFEAEKEREKQIKNKINKMQNEIKRIEAQQEDDQNERIVREKEWCETKIEELENRLQQINGNNQSETLLQNINMQLKEVKEEYETLLKISQRPLPSRVTENQFNELNQKIEQIQREEEGLESQKDERINEREIMNELNETERQLEHQRRQYDELSRRNPTFRYSKPYDNFDDRKVDGLIITLFKPVDKLYSTALEIAAGGRMFHVVCDTDETAQLLVERKCLKKRMTFVPLNKINVNLPHYSQIQKAKEIGGNKIHYALDCIASNDKYSDVMKYVFGNILIADDSETAKRVCFDPKVMLKTVTLQGDLYDPSGILTGGSKPKSNGIIDAVVRQYEMGGLIQQTENKLRRLEDQQKIIQNNKRIDQQIIILKERQKSIENEIERLKQSAENYEKLSKEKMKNMTKCEEKKREINDLQQRKNEIIQEQQQIAMGQGEELRRGLEKQLKEEQMKLKKYNDQIEYVQQQIKQREKDRIKAEEWKKEIEELTQELHSINNKANELQQLIQNQTQQYDQITNEIHEIKRKKEEILQRNQQRVALVAQRKREISEKEQQKKKIEKDFENQKEIITNLKKYLEQIERKFVWIKSEKKMFNKEGGRFNFNGFDVNAAKNLLQQKSKEILEIDHGVNKQVLAHQQEIETQYQNLISRKTIIENDKTKIVRVIADLDKKKTEEIEKAYNTINEKFGQIFGSLHPGANARLKAADGQNIFEGIEAEVQFGDLWKESLLELSGGQQSLLALSLILAILVYKPSPLYILDEVDAALDVSNTQNFGGMLREHFKDSQFIVVSLKSGMFDNANIVFNTKVINNISSVTRTVGKTRTPNQQRRMEDE